MCFDYISDTPVKGLHYAIGYGRAWLGQPVLNVQGLEQMVKLLVARAWRSRLANNQLVNSLPLPELQRALSWPLSQHG